MLTAIVLMAAGVAGLSSSAANAQSVTVTSDADVGDGSLRDAIAQANADAAINLIIIKQDVCTIEIGSALEYTGAQDLSVDGKGATILAADTFADVGMVISSSGANLSLWRLTIDGDFEEGETGANGVLIPVPAEQEGELSVFLKDVSLVNNGLFGLHIADQEDDSDATLRLTVLDSLVANNGIGESDFDGIRVDDGGGGDIITNIVNSQIDGNGGDGLELDERGEGIVELDVVGSSFSGNGFFDPEDLDDGLDIDEADDGGMVVRIVNSTFTDNFDEGLDLDEEDAGDVQVSIVNVNADNNIDEGIKISEEDGGGLFAMLSNVTVIGSQDDDGIQLEEADEGSLDVTVVNLIATDNDKFGLKVEQETVGEDTGTLKLRNSTLEPNGDGELDLEGVDLE
jgi:hypothetical protein